MATVTLFLCCLLGSVSLVYGQTLCELICSATSFTVILQTEFIALARSIKHCATIQCGVSIMCLVSEHQLLH